MSLIVAAIVMRLVTATATSAQVDHAGQAIFRDWTSMASQRALRTAVHARVGTMLQPAHLPLLTG